MNPVASIQTAGASSAKELVLRLLQAARHIRASPPFKSRKLLISVYLR